MKNCPKCGRELRPVWNSTLYHPCGYCNTLKNKAILKNSSMKTGKHRDKPKKGKTPRQKAMISADKWFSLYIRIKYSYQIIDGEVYDQCIINPSIIKHAKEMDNGHCFSRDCKILRYNENDCRPQNRSSNRFSGEADHYIFIDNLKKQIGEDAFNELEQLRHHNIIDNEAFYLENSEKYRKLVNEMVKEFDIKKWW